MRRARRWLGRCLYLGGGRNPPPQRRSHPRIAVSMFLVVSSGRGHTDLYGSHGRAFGFRPRTTPSPRFHSFFRCVASATGFLRLRFSAALIRRPGRPSENARGANANALAPARVSTHAPHPARATAARSAKIRGTPSRRFNKFCRPTTDIYFEQISSFEHMRSDSRTYEARNTKLSTDNRRMRREPSFVRHDCR